MPNRQSSKQLRNKAASVALPDYKVPVKDFGFYVAYWKDIESDPTWRTLKDIQSSKPAICISTGWLVRKDKENHVLMSDFNFGKAILAPTMPTAWIAASLDSLFSSLRPSVSIAA